MMRKCFAEDGTDRHPQQEAAWGAIVAETTAPRQSGSWVGGRGSWIALTTKSQTRSHHMALHLSSVRRISGGSPLCTGRPFARFFRRNDETCVIDRFQPHTKRRSSVVRFGPKAPKQSPDALSQNRSPVTCGPRMLRHAYPYVDWKTNTSCHPYRNLDPVIAPCARCHRAVNAKQIHLCSPQPDPATVSPRHAPLARLSRPSASPSSSYWSNTDMAASPPGSGPDNPIGSHAIPPSFPL